MSPRRYFLCGLLLDGRRLLFLHDQDGIEQSALGTILTFRTHDAALAWTTARGIVLHDDPPEWYDFDRIAAWCERPAATGIDCAEFLIAWHLLCDLPDSTSVFRASVDGTPIYAKLFDGCNLFSSTPPGEAYTPSWSGAELTELARVLRFGLAELRRRLPAAAA